MAARSPFARRETLSVDSGTLGNLRQRHRESERGPEHGMACELG